MTTTAPRRPSTDAELHDEFMEERSWATETKVLLGLLVALLLILLLLALLIWATTGSDEQGAADFSDAPAPLGPTLDAPVDVHALALAMAPFGTVVAAAENNVAVLRGTVSSAAEAQAARDTALSVAGIVAVDDQLAIVGTNGSTEAASNDVLHAVAAAVGNAVDDVSNLRVRVERETAVLWGAVRSQSDSDAAARAALSIVGIERVDNQLGLLLPETEINDRLELSPIRFDTGSARIRPESTDTLSAIIRILEITDEAFEVQGFTDVVGSAGKNQALSQERADAVVQYLLANGVTNRLTAVGYGETDRFAAGASSAALQANRRVQFIRR